MYQSNKSYNYFRLNYFLSISRDRNIRDDFHGSRSRGKVITYTPFHFSFTVPLKVVSSDKSYHGYWLFIEPGCRGKYYFLTL